MTPQKIVRQGLEAVKDEAIFRKWVELWIPEATSRHCGFCIYELSLAELAFLAREVAGDKWVYSCQYVYEIADDVTGTLSGWFMRPRCTPCHWIIAGCVAMEMQKKEKP